MKRKKQYFVLQKILWHFSHMMVQKAECKFGDRVPKASDKYQSYKNAYGILQKGLARCAEEDDTGLIINNLTTYQCVLGSKLNHKYRMNLPESIRQFYRFDEII